ncbi:MAG: HAD-IA family hydrolase [Desulfitobacteriaceae bacterium]|nr:HAD-IA family hydrolase [Desulfitobacteriaceae bacterium]MDD4751890.1 HAD-IA family hydrolase [Desulfitobacteriaceae bacterium]
MRIDTALFDLDGTVTDSLPLIRRTYFSVFQEMCIPWGDEDVMKLIGLPLKEIGRIMAGAGKEDEFFDTYQRHYRETHDKLMDLFPGARKVLHELRQNRYALGIVTSKSRYGADMTLSLLDLNNFFDVVITADDSEKHKPNPDPVLVALKKLNKTAEKAVYVGDSPFDIMAGNGAGVTTIAVTWGMADKTELLKHNPNKIVDSWIELAGWLTAQNE